MNKRLKTKRSVGVTSCAVCFLVGSLPAFVFAVIAGLSGPPDARLLDTAIRLGSLSSPLIFILTGIGLFMLRTWGRWMAVFFSPLLAFIFLGVFGMLFFKIIPPDSLSMIIKIGPIILFVVISAYFFCPSVKEQFK